MLNYDKKLLINAINFSIKTSYAFLILGTIAAIATTILAVFLCLNLSIPLFIATAVTSSAAFLFLGIGQGAISPITYDLCKDFFQNLKSKFQKLWSKDSSEKQVDNKLYSKNENEHKDKFINLTEEKELTTIRKIENNSPSSFLVGDTFFKNIGFTNPNNGGKKLIEIENQPTFVQLDAF